MLCTKLQGCLARLRCVFLNFSQILQKLKVAGQYFGTFWALLSVCCRDCSYLDLPRNYCFFFTVWVRWEECLPGSAHHKPAKGVLCFGELNLRLFEHDPEEGRQLELQLHLSCLQRLLPKKEPMDRIRYQAMLVHPHQPLMMDMSCRE